MKLVQKATIMIASLVASKHAIASATATAATAALLAPTMGSDPFTWFFSGIGAVVAHLKMTETIRRVAIANGVISVILGGLGAPFINALLTKNEYPQMPVYLAGFILSVSWPFLMKKAVELWDKKVMS